MRPWERRMFNLSALVVGVTGLAYFWMKYAMETDDPFALVNHPWQTTMLALHVVASPVMVLVFGIVLNSHIMRKLGAYRAPTRKSGLVSLATFAAMVVSGYLLQVTSSEAWLRALVVVHIASGIGFSAAYVVHLIASAVCARRFRAVAARQVA